MRRMAVGIFVLAVMTSAACHKNKPPVVGVKKNDVATVVAFVFKS